MKNSEAQNQVDLKSKKASDPSPFSFGLLIPVSMIWLISSLAIDSPEEINNLGVPNWLVLTVVGVVIHSALLIGKHELLKLINPNKPIRFEGFIESVLIIISSMSATFLLSLVASVSALDLDSLIIQLVLLLIVLRYSKKLIRYQREVSRLSHEQLQLLRGKQLTREGLREIESQARLRKEEIENELKKVFELGKAAISEKLWIISESVVRPLSHELSRPVPALTEPANVIWKPNWKAFSKELARKANLRPLLTALGTSLVLFAFSLQIGSTENLPVPQPESDGLQVVVDVASILGFLTQLAVAFVVSWLAVFMGKKFLKSLRVINRIPDTTLRFGSALVISSLLSLLLSMILIELFFRDENFIFAGMPVVIALSVFLFGLISATSQSLKSFTDTVVQTVLDENHRLRWETARLHQQIWQARRKLGKLLHGPIRSTLISAAIIYKENQANPPSLESLTDYTSGQFKRLKETSKNPLQALEETIVLWRDNCEIDLKLEKQEQAKISQDPVASEVLSDLLCDAILNSVVHGGASKLAIEVIREHNKLSVSVSDDGQMTEDPTPGLGSKMLDENTLWWSLQDGQGATVLKAEIPFQIPRELEEQASNASPR